MSVDFSRGEESSQFIQIIKDNPGLIAEKIAPLATSSSDWKIIQKIDLRAYFKTGAELTNQGVLVWRLCQPRCDVKVLQRGVREAVRQAERVLDLILVHDVDEEPWRTRRSLLPFIGTIHKLLFGTLNENDEAKIQSAIQAIASDTRITAALLANQTEVIEHSLSNLGNKMAGLEVITAVLTNKSIEFGSELVAQKAVQSLQDSLPQFKLDTEVLTDAILFAAKGMVHPRIMPPDTISRAAKIANSAIANADFPLPDGQFSAIPIMKISRLSVLFSKGFLIYFLSITMLDIQKFNLFKASPLPTVQLILNASSIAAYIWPEYRYESSENF